MRKRSYVPEKYKKPTTKHRFKMCARCTGKAKTLLKQKKIRFIQAKDGALHIFAHNRDDVSQLLHKNDIGETSVYSND